MFVAFNFIFNLIGSDQWRLIVVIFEAELAQNARFKLQVLIELISQSISYLVLGWHVRWTELVKKK